MDQDQIIHNALVNTGLDLVILGIAFAISFYISVRAQSGFFISLLAVLTGWILAAIMGLALHFELGAGAFNEQVVVGGSFWLALMGTWIGRRRRKKTSLVNEEKAGATGTVPSKDGSTSRGSQALQEQGAIDQQYYGAKEEKVSTAVDKIELAEKQSPPPITLSKEEEQEEWDVLVKYKAGLREKYRELKELSEDAAAEFRKQVIGLSVEERTAEDINNIHDKVKMQFTAAKWQSIYPFKRPQLNVLYQELNSENLAYGAELKRIVGIAGEDVDIEVVKEQLLEKKN